MEKKDFQSLCWGLGRVHDELINESLAESRFLPYGYWGETGTRQTPYGFTGEMEDEDLVYLRNRYYSHQFGTFLSQDPVEGEFSDPMSLNRYMYVAGNPVNLTDPSGLQAQSNISCDCCADPTSGNLCKLINAAFPYGAELGCACPAPSLPTQPPISTPVPTFVLTPEIVACPTPPPSLTPAPTFTPAPQFTPTQVPIRLPVDNGLLSNCDFVARTGSGIPSRDLNPPGVATPSFIYAPAPAEVMIVETTGDTVGLGNFVAVRVHTSNLPVGRNKWGSGWLYIGYAHLSEVYVQANELGPFQTVQPGIPIGKTGSSGTDNTHLDLTTFFVPDSSVLGFDPIPYDTGVTDPGTGSRAYQYFNSFYTLGLTTRYQPTIVDPLEIWPELAAGTVCILPTQ